MAQSGNGGDVAAVYQLLTEVAGTVRSHSEALGGIRGEIGEMRRRMDEFGVGLADLRASVDDLREAVRNYHTTVIGHGVLYGELEQRIRRIERHLKLEPT